MDNSEEQKRLSKLTLRKLLTAEEVINPELADLKRHADKLKQFESGKNIQVHIGDDSFNGGKVIRLYIAEHILSSMISESIKQKEIRLLEVQEAIDTEINRLAKEMDE